MRSDVVKKGIPAAPNRSLLHNPHYHGIGLQFSSSFLIIVSHHRFSSFLIVLHLVFLRTTTESLSKTGDVPYDPVENLRVRAICDYGTFTAAATAARLSLIAVGAVNVPLLLLLF